ncbi:MAG: PDZ domain-containing protein, partial [Lewinella sp.]|nr:PDZ domain-containing protein [Lewinella sp.]
MKHLVVFTLLSLFTTTVFAQKSSCEQETGRAFLGVTTDELDDTKVSLLNLPTDDGAYVTKVYPGLAADKAGIKPFDYIVAVEGEALDHGDDLTDLLSRHRPGDVVNIDLIRRGEPMTVAATLSDRQNYSVEWNYDQGEAFLGVSPDHDDEEDEM